MLWETNMYTICDKKKTAENSRYRVYNDIMIINVQLSWTKLNSKGKHRH